MTVVSPWGQHLKELMQEHHVSERGLCAHTGVNRGSLRRFLAGDAYLDLNRLAVILAAFGYDIDIVRVGEPTIPLKQPEEAPVKQPNVKQPPQKAKKLRLKKIARAPMRLACETLGY